jgi:hypothetical protein
MKTIFEKNFLISAGILAILILPFLLLSRYDLPSYDDYTVPDIINRLGYFQTQWHWYTNWGGRYSASGLIALVHPMIYAKSGIGLYGLFSAFILLGFIVALYRFIAALIPSASAGYKLGALAGLLFVYLFKMPSPTEGFYWMVGAWTYTFGVIVALELGTRILHYSLNKNNFQFACILFLAFLLPGTSEVIDIMFIATYCLVLSLIFFQKGKIDRTHYIVLGVIAFFTLVSFLAPGNSVRATNVVESGMASKDLSIVIPQTIKLGLKYMIQWTLLGPFLLIAFLSLSIKSKLRDDLLILVNNWFKFGYWLLASYGFVFVFIFPVLWSSGVPPDRIFNPIALYFMIMTIINLMFLFNLLKIRNIEIPMQAAIMVCLFLFGYTLTSQNRISRTWIEVRSGQAKAYYSEMQDIYTMCKENPNKKFVIRPMQNRPNTIFINDLHEDSTHWENRFFSKFHGIGSARTGDSTVTYIEPF